MNNNNSTNNDDKTDEQSIERSASHQDQRSPQADGVAESQTNGNRSMPPSTNENRNIFKRIERNRTQLNAVSGGKANRQTYYIF